MGSENGKDVDEDILEAGVDVGVRVTEEVELRNGVLVALTGVLVEYPPFRLGSEKGKDVVALDKIFALGAEAGSVSFVAEELGMGNGLRIASEIEPGKRDEDAEDVGTLAEGVMTHHYQSKT